MHLDTPSKVYFIREIYEKEIREEFAQKEKRMELNPLRASIGHQLEIKGKEVIKQIQTSNGQDGASRPQISEID